MAAVLHRDVALQIIPKVMRAAVLDRFGGPEVLTLHTLPMPEPAAGELLIAVHTAGVGRWDAHIRDGWSPSGRKPRFPLVLGTDGSGVVAAVGPRVRRFQIGDAVYGYSWDNPKGGFYAEYVVVPADNAAPVPRRLDLRQAGALPVIGLTALQGIDDALRLKPRERVIIHGASGGVGTMAVQFAKWRRARVFATAAGEDGVALVRRLGADTAIDGKHDDLAQALQRFAPDGADAVLGLAGGDPLERCLDTLRRGGRLVYPNGVEPVPKKRRRIETIRYDAVPGVREFEQLNRAVEGARARVPIAAEFDLADARKAHERLAGHVVGKIVLRVR